jgi:hypothetical protein
MKVNIILFISGSGGNFLARVFTLDPKTVPIGGIGDDAESRFKRYHYSNIDKILKNSYNKFLENGLSEWVSIELEQMFFPLTMGVETLTQLNKTVIEPMHPNHFDTKSQFFGVDDEVILFYIDPTECEEWIVKQQIHKGACKIIKNFSDMLQTVTKDIEFLNLKATNARPISLKKIISSKDTFLEEYKKICTVMNLKNYDYFALEIYDSWTKTWG